MAESIFEFDVYNINGEKESLNKYNGKVSLIVNVASKCGFTPQYTELEEVYKKYQAAGFVVLAFPCNQFGAQEPGNEEEIKNFCSLNYSTTFPIFKKIEVNGDKADPLYTYLKSEASGIFGTESIKWNFTKFLVDKNGKVMKRFAPTDKPLDLIPHIEELLKK